ncbi:outer membrane immunogenic protein [Sphingomonas vulcanisoli]|uniref:Outer membrane immunogenic protein n=1 Tax=Sphingomonas vulcanisoli TaxID=1658060 RepID=A0ABX0TSC2_9SPHN|nr:porin family protein [Sphingomonas vulcanisoli]NIJ08361.1 outer membrane immunogenic protein [Sphingomonas vulcanisoli]
MMYKFLLSSVLALGVAGAASAQTADAPTWSGPYGGLHAGYGFDDGRTQTITGIGSGTSAAVASGARPSQLNLNRSGFVGGGQIGWNFQSGKWVFGPEGDISYLRTRGTESISSSTASGAQQNTTIRNRMEWMGSARLRAGYTLGDGLIYATGGYAFGKVKASAAFNSPTGVQNYAGRNGYTAQGWIAGIGGEFRPFHNGAASRVSFGPELTYYDLGSNHTYAGAQNATVANTGYYVVGRDMRGFNGVIKLNYVF